MTTLSGIGGSFAILVAIVVSDFRLGLLGLALCLFSACADGWLDHRRHRGSLALRERLKARRAIPGKQGPQNWRG